MDAIVLFAATGDPTLWSEIVGWTWSISSVAIGLGFVVFVHELGHFLVAKACGVKCEKFYVGFDIFNLRFCRFQWGETEYGIGALPLGGYVKMLGQDDDPRHAMAEAERIKVIQEGTAAEGLTPGHTAEQPQQFVLDPRSYPAKSVPARMAIISAGVIMNVIFGALLGAWAYWLGVEEMPALVGSTIPGGPAYVANVQPGMKFVGINGAKYDHYRFIDIKQHIILNGDSQKLDFTVRTRDGEEKSIALQPTSRAVSETKFPTIGYLQPESSVIIERVDHLRPNSSMTLKSGDRIIEINGIPLDTGKEGNEVFDYRLNAELARNPSQPIQVVIERTAKDDSGKKLPAERHQVTIEPKPQRTVGLVMEMGPIVAIREGSPAQRAGLQVNDVIQKVNGDLVGDPLSLGQRLIPKDDSESWTFVVARKGADGAMTTRSIDVKPELPDQYFEDYRTGGPVSIESIGAAYQVTNKVAAVEPGSSAEKEGLQPGDVITKVKLLPTNDADKKEEEAELAKGKVYDEMELDSDVRSWTRVHFYLQVVLPQTRLQVTAKRGNSEVVKTLSAAESDSFYSESRGLAFMPVTVTHIASSPGEALYLGVREIKEGVTQVISTVGALVTGRVSAEHMSGPVGILGAAGRIASSGLPALLIFLTFLSANLAVLNILPIPVLDGGHLLFLTWEGITRKPVNPNVQGYLSLVGLVLLLLLMIYATKNDIMRSFS